MGVYGYICVLGTNFSLKAHRVDVVREEGT